MSINSRIEINCTDLLWINNCTSVVLFTVQLTILLLNNGEPLIIAQSESPLYDVFQTKVILGKTVLETNICQTSNESLHQEFLILKIAEGWEPKLSLSGAELAP